MAITLSAAAEKHIIRNLSERKQGVGVRLGVKTTGCSGLAYVIGFIFKNPNVSAECGCGESFTVN